MRAPTKRAPRKPARTAPKSGQDSKKGTSGSKIRGRTQGPKPEAILLIGATGSGKTPLGLVLEKHDLAGQRCVHFDFGANLREVAVLTRRPAGFTAEDMAVIRDSLKTGALLENENFPIAEKILKRFSLRHRVRRGDLLILNGLPRHEGQAADLERTVAVKSVIYLDASLDTILKRIKRDAGGDRSGRLDDSSEEIRRKYATFQKRTKPLLDHYSRRGARILRLPIGADSTPGDVIVNLLRAWD